MRRTSTPSDPLRRLRLTLAWLSFAACTAAEPPPPASDSGAPSPANPFTPEAGVTRVVVEIDYQRGAEPYTGSGVALGDTWRLFQTNAAKLFEGTGITVDVPTTLDRMQRLDDVRGEQFSGETILAIARAHRDRQTAGGMLSYYVVWLDGVFEENGAAKDKVLGVSLGSTGVIAMFKPVIESAGLPLVPDLSRVVEQTTLVHEFGHALGLVANGLPLTSAHHDAPNGAHCTNDRCVMYHTVDGVEAAREYAQRNVTRADVVLFGDECLADVAAATRR